MTPLELDILAVFRAVRDGSNLADALAEHDESGHVADWIVMRVREVSPWISRVLDLSVPA